jgi:hypothetical protein
VKSASDLPEAQKIQAQYLLSPLSAYPSGLKGAIVQENALSVLPALDLSNAGADYFDKLDALLKSYPPSPQDASVVAGFADDLLLTARHSASA